MKLVDTGQQMRKEERGRRFVDRKGNTGQNDKIENSN